MTSFYRGKRVSEYRKQSGHVQGAFSATGATRYKLTVGPGDRIRAIKNIRALITIYGGDSSPYNNWSYGMVCLFRCPIGDYPNGVLDIEQSAVLHPVPYAMGGGPLTIAYEFGGITAGQSEEVWLVAQSVNSAGTNYHVIASEWAQKDTLTP